MKAPHGSRPGDRSLFVICLGFAILIAAIVYSAGCSPCPTGPTAVQKVQEHQWDQLRPSQTSQVDPRTLDLANLTLEHDPFADGVQVCRTQLRAYSDGWEVDYYTVRYPETCPAEPIE